MELQLFVKTPLRETLTSHSSKRSKTHGSEAAATARAGHRLVHHRRRNCCPQARPFRHHRSPPTHLRGQAGKPSKQNKAKRENLVEQIPQKLQSFFHYCREGFRFCVGFAEGKGFTYANCAEEIPQSNGRLCSTLSPLIPAYALPAMATGLLKFSFKFQCFKR